MMSYESKKANSISCSPIFSVFTNGGGGGPKKKFIFAIDGPNGGGGAYKIPNFKIKNLRTA